MTTHVVCLDGTGQVRTQANPTNIALTFNAMGGMIVDADNNSYESTLTSGVTVQVGKYLAGVGTGGIELFDVIKQADGEGIAEPIVRGYTFLSRNYQMGDEIIIIGFSRGAAAARCLAGFVVGQGLLNPANYHPENKNSAYLRGVAAWYKYRSEQPNLAKYANLTNIFLKLGEDVPELTLADFVPVERILAIAVYDTVSSMGIPRPVTDGLDYDFVLADTNLSPKVLTGYHALSADENRANFFPTYWTPRHNVTQVIFPGSHSDVGGGYAETGLSDRALQWMLPNLKAQGLRFDLANIKRALAPLSTAIGHDDGIVGPWNLLPKAPRVFPTDPFEGAPPFQADRSIGERWGKPVTLLPGKRQSTYKSIGVFTGDRPLYP
jgi:uncharacterized protein (DUF2235 family)